MPEKPMNQRLREASLRACLEELEVPAGEPGIEPPSLEGEGPRALKGGASRFLIHPDLVVSCKVEWPDVDLD
jgi:hypothetical protein